MKRKEKKNEKTEYKIQNTKYEKKINTDIESIEN